MVLSTVQLSGEWCKLLKVNKGGARQGEGYLYTVECGGFVKLGFSGDLSTRFRSLLTVPQPNTPWGTRKLIDLAFWPISMAWRAGEQREELQFHKTHGRDQVVTKGARSSEWYPIESSAAEVLKTMTGWVTVVCIFETKRVFRGLAGMLPPCTLPRPAFRPPPDLDPEEAIKEFKAKW